MVILLLLLLWYYIFWECVCSLRYPACNARASYCHLWPVWFYNTFPHYLINGTILGRNYLTQNVCFDFPYNFIWNISHYKTNSARYYHKRTSVFMQITRYSCHILMKLEFSRQIFENYSNIKFYENPSNGRRVFPCGRTDGQTWHDEAKSRISQCCEGT
jgi:hypothetical protein